MTNLKLDSYNLFRKAKSQPEFKNDLKEFAIRLKGGWSKASNTDEISYPQIQKELQQLYPALLEQENKKDREFSRRTPMPSSHSNISYSRTFKSFTPVIQPSIIFNQRAAEMFSTKEQLHLSKKEKESSFQFLNESIQNQSEFFQQPILKFCLKQVKTKKLLTKDSLAETLMNSRIIKLQEVKIKTEKGLRKSPTNLTQYIRAKTLIKQRQIKKPLQYSDVGIKKDEQQKIKKSNVELHLQNIKNSPWSQKFRFTTSNYRQLFTYNDEKPIFKS